jgi:hypothetical protein
MSILELAYLIDRDDVRMVERGSDSRLLLKAAHAFYVPNEFDRQNLERDLSAQIAVLCQITSPIPPTPSDDKIL